MYAVPSKSVCGVTEPGFTTTWPRSTSSRLVPRRSRPQFSPAQASSSCLWNISIPVTVVFCVGRIPTISTSELMARVPRSARPVTTVPRPVIVQTSSIGIRNGFFFFGARETLEARDANDGSVVSVEALAGQQLANLELNELKDLLVVDHVRLVER